MGVLIKSFGITTTHAFAANVVAALMINFVMRKKVVFKG
jgi:putative flippase GtrA